MFKLPSLILMFLVLTLDVFAQSPHGAKLSIKCDVCHSSDSWAFKMKDNSFDHSKTDFPLIGQHAMVGCKKCHVDLVFSNAKTNCKSCHIDVHQQTVGQDCERCHSPVSWTVKNVTQMHQLSRFPLHGAHVQTDCNKCHKSASLLRYDPLGTECVDCHLPDYNATTNPAHADAKFPKNCVLCHDDVSWSSATFDHNTSTTFQLKGGHIGVDCISCHSKGFVGTSKECQSCHLADYNATTNPAHAAANFSKECQTCHNEAAWKPSTFNHNTSTTFQLKGGHIGVDCISCHSKGFVGTSKECQSCHLTDYNATTNPAHAAANFSKDCQTCHNETTWIPSTFNHNTSTSFPLTGGHVGVNCLQCHSKGYSGTSKLCQSCHLPDYNSTTNPNHALAKFPLNCESCHNVNAWIPANFNHDAQYFPIYSGTHRGRWSQCSECHTNASNFAVFSCLNCHEHNKTSMDSKHKGRSGYVYNSTNCLSCHPRGRAG